MLMDAPIGEWTDLIKFAADRKTWRTRVHKLKTAAMPNATNTASRTTSTSTSTIINSTATKQPPRKS